MGSCSRRHFIKKIGTGFLATCLVPATGWSALLPDNTRRSSLFTTPTPANGSVSAILETVPIAPAAWGR